MEQHDDSYQLLFSNPLMIQSLFDGLLQIASPGMLLPTANEMDWSRAEALPANFITKNLRQRHSDCIWRIPRHGGGDVHLLLLLEFQSSNDTHMALRITIYVLLLYDSLIKQNKLLPGNPYPTVLSVVLYNGVAPWTAATRLADKLGDTPLFPDLMPNGGYILVDEGELLRQGKVPPTGLISLLIRLEHCPSIEQFQELVQTIIIQTAGADYAPVRDALLVWIKQVLWPRNVPSQDIHHVHTFKEFHAMLIESHVSWTDRLLIQGKKEGQEKGIQIGHAGMLQRQLTHRFGSLPQTLQDRLRQATPKQLETWSLNLLDASSLEQVFQENYSNRCNTFNFPVTSRAVLTSPLTYPEFPGL